MWYCLTFQASSGVLRMYSPQTAVGDCCILKTIDSIPEIGHDFYFSLKM